MTCVVDQFQKRSFIFSDDGECSYFTTILSSALFLLKTFSHFEYFKAWRMCAIVQNYGENPNEVYSIFVFRISLANSTNFSFIESSRHALSSSTTAPAKTHTR